MYIRNVSLKLEISKQFSNQFKKEGVDRFLVNLLIYETIDYEKYAVYMFV